MVEVPNRSANPAEMVGPVGIDTPAGVVAGSFKPLRKSKPTVDIKAKGDSSKHFKLDIVKKFLFLIISFHIIFMTKILLTHKCVSFLVGKLLYKY